MNDKDPIEQELAASERRAQRIKVIKEEFSNEEDSDIAKLLAEIEARNKKNYDQD